VQAGVNMSSGVWLGGGKSKETLTHQFVLQEAGCCAERQAEQQLLTSCSRLRMWQALRPSAGAEQQVGWLVRGLRQSPGWLGRSLTVAYEGRLSCQEPALPRLKGRMVCMSDLPDTKVCPRCAHWRAAAGALLCCHGTRSRSCAARLCRKWGQAGSCKLAQKGTGVS
jgi:hypothetical protein